MDIITDHKILLAKLDETRNELDKLQENSKRTSFHYSRKIDTEFTDRSRKDINFSSSDYIQPREFVTKRNKREISSDTDESVCEEELPSKKANLQSAVILKTESKKDVITKQNINKKVQSRNRRILGMLQSTLQKFQDDAVKRQPQDLKRMTVEQKVEAAKMDEKVRMEKEEEELFLKMKEKRQELDCLEQMIKVTESFAAWKSNKMESLNFIQTKTEPKICFLPASHTLSTKKQLEKTRLAILESIERQEKALKKELVNIKESFTAANSDKLDDTLN